jgi:alginate O-acetyltransferase complex protein AlgI
MLAAAPDIGWLGFSYIAFRLMHTLRDRATGILPLLGFRDYLSYVVFTPALVAGPIDRAENHLAAVDALPAMRMWDAGRIVPALGRIASGLFKKFVVADTLAIFSLSTLTAEQAQGAGGLWLLLYAYAFRLFFDFSGYTDIAIGLGMLFGVKLPENFDRPYLKHNLTAFWQSWHKSLSDWARFYIYSPISRALLKRRPKPSNYVIIFAATAATFIVIGLWHGITLPFFIWGAWHALGLFGHKLWTDRTREWYRGLADRPRRVWHAFGVLLTFHFVALGWVWFALPDAGQALRVFAGLAGIGGGP